MVSVYVPIRPGGLLLDFEFCVHFVRRAREKKQRCTQIMVKGVMGRVWLFE